MFLGGIKFEEKVEQGGERWEQTPRGHLVPSQFIWAEDVYGERIHHARQGSFFSPAVGG